MQLDKMGLPPVCTRSLGKQNSYECWWNYMYMIAVNGGIWLRLLCCPINHARGICLINHTCTHIKLSASIAICAVYSHSQHMFRRCHMTRPDNRQCPQYSWSQCSQAHKSSCSHQQSSIQGKQKEWIVSTVSYTYNCNTYMVFWQ